MGFWSNLLGIGEIVGGAVAAPFTGGATIPLIGAGANTLIGQHAANKASEQQQTAAKAAQTQLTPYTSLGGNAASTLSFLLGISPQAGPQSSALLPGGVGSPQGNAAGVLMAAPDGSQKLVPASQVEHYKTKGATVLSYAGMGPGWTAAGPPMGGAGSAAQREIQALLDPNLSQGAQVVPLGTAVSR